MADGIGDRFMADSEQGIGDAQRKRSLTAGSCSSYRNRRAAIDQPTRALLQSAEQPGRLQVFRPQGRNAAPGFFMAVAHHFTRHTELWKDVGLLTGLILNRFQLKTDAGKALR